MQKLLLFCSVFMLLTAFQCSKNEPQVELTRAVLDQKKATLLEWVESVPCQEATGCSYIALGSKPCGGPWEYLLYSNAMDVETLTLMVIDYNELEHQFNLQTGAISDCMMVMPPNATICSSDGCVGQ